MCLQKTLMKHTVYERGRCACFLLPFKTLTGSLELLHVVIRSARYFQNEALKLLETWTKLG